MSASKKELEENQRATLDDRLLMLKSDSENKKCRKQERAKRIESIKTIEKKLPLHYPFYCFYIDPEINETIVTPPSRMQLFQSLIIF